MSSRIAIKRICQHCSSEFTAQTTVTRYCSHKCSSAAHKKRTRDSKIEQSNKQTQQVRNLPIEQLKAKEFLNVREVSLLLNCSVRSAYYYIESGTIKAVNLGQRITRVKRSEIDKLFEEPQPVLLQSEQTQFDISECYSTEEVRSKFGISESALRGLIIRFKIPKFRKGWYAYVPKIIIDVHLN